MAMCLLALTYVLSGDGALRLLNYQTSAELNAYLRSSSNHSTVIISNMTNLGTRSLHTKYVNSATEDSEYIYHSKSPSSVPTHRTHKPTAVPSAKPSLAPTPSPTAVPSVTPTSAPTHKLPPLPNFILASHHQDSVTTSRGVVLLSMLSFMFFFWASVGILSWLLAAESFPIRIRAKGMVAVFGERFAPTS